MKSRKSLSIATLLGACLLASNAVAQFSGPAGRYLWVKSLEVVN